MKTKKLSGKMSIMKLILVLPVIVFLLFAFLSCATKKKASSVHTEIAPPPPPPPPPTSNKSTEVTDEFGEVPYVVVDEMPIFPGGDEALLKYIAENTKYPEASKNQKIQGKVILRFCVTEKGAVNRISILKSVAPDLDAEAIRVVQTLPAFKPGRQSGRDVPVWYMVPITFALN
jgi:TonB family protein